MSGEDSDAEPHHKRKRKLRPLEDSPESTSSDGSPIIGSSSSRRRRPFQDRNPIRTSSDSESDSDLSILIHNKRKKVRRVASDSDSGSSGSIITRTKKTGRIASDSDDLDMSDRGFEGSSSSQWETDLSDTEPVKKVKPEAATSSAAPDINIDSDSSDGQSEKCPICLLTFKSQEIGTPESCDHMFCLECIQEWSKNMNTCPVDRQEYSLILVREDINARVTRQVPIEKPAPQNDVDIVEDPTFCEVCGTSDNEDQMLLCDGCDLGFHLYCLTPPLDEVPIGAWYCNDCSPDDEYNSEIELYEVQLLLDEAATIERALGHRRSHSTRLVPRTRQSERVRRRIANNRRENRRRTHLDGPSTSSLEDSQVVNSVSSTTSRVKRKPTKRKKSKKSKLQVRYKTVYKIDEVTGETIAVRKQLKKRKNPRRKRTLERTTARPKTVKKRLAVQLGICAPRTVPQNLPDVKIQSSSNTLGGLRYQAGIPTLHLFGQSNQLDYFSGEDEDSFEVGSGVQLLTARAPNRSDISALRRVARRKAAVSFSSVVSSSTDLLDSILSSQEQLHSRNADYSVDSSGKFMIEQKKSEKNYVDVKKQPVTVRQRPNNSYYQGNNNPNPNYGRSNPNNYHSQSHYQYHSTPTSTMESVGASGYGGGDYNEAPQDYTQRTLCASSEANTQQMNDGDDDANSSFTTNSESDIDIYSDIETETVSTSRIDYEDLRPPPSPPFLPDFLTPNTGTDEDVNDSEPDMVIDDDKVQEVERLQEDHIEEAAVTSTVGFSGEFVPMAVDSASELPHSSMEIQSEAIQSSNLMDNKPMEDEEDWGDGCPNTSIYSKESIEASKETEEVDSDDGCPNFSIYSKESKSLALHTDISLSAEDNMQQDYQVGEVSSSPNMAGDGNLPPEEKESENITYPFEKGETTSSPKAQEELPPEDLRPEETENDGENVVYDFEKEAPFPPDNSEENVGENVIYDFEREPNVGVSENAEENVTYEFEKFTDQNQDISNPVSDHSNPPNPVAGSRVGVVQKLVSGGILGGLYSDSEDESVVKKDGNTFAISDINHMTEDISEEERSYTPCLDERGHRQGLEGLDTEMISDEDRNDFDESHELKTVSDGDALEINAKESELDFTRPEDYEEGEIVDKNKAAKKAEETEKEKKKVKSKVTVEEGKDGKKPKKKEKEKPPTEAERGGNKENEAHNREAAFKKLSKNNKERNYREKDGSSPSRFKDDRQQNKKEKKREKRKEIERYNVRAIIAEKPRPLIIKDQFGRDIRRTPSRSKSRSHTPPPVRGSPSKIVASPTKIQRSPSRHRSLSRQKSRSPSRHRSLSRGHKSPSRIRVRKRRPRSRPRSGSRSRSRTPGKKRSRSKNKKRKRSSSRYKRRKSRDRPKKKPRNRSRNRSASPSRRVNREWNARRGWTPLSMSPLPEIPQMTQSWTPPRVIDTSHLLNRESLAAAINSNRKKKEKKRKAEKRNKDGTTGKQRKRRRERERTPPPSKEVFASGDNILVSVSFNNENETRDVTTRERRKKDMEDMNRKKKEKRRNKNRKDLSGIKPVAIIDLERSPFKEITPSPKDVIVLTDSDNNDNEEVSRSVQNNICDSSQQVASPERSINYSMGPKTPPEPQVKFSLSAKPPQVRAISNPLHDPDDIENNDDVQEEINSRMNEGLHKGPNTPPEPPNSPPSSPDAYDPFEPTKSRSPTPEPMQSIQSNIGLGESTLESRAAIELLEKSINPTNPELIKSLTPPIADVQPADSQSSIQATPESNIGKSPERISVVINQTVQPSKPVAQTTPFSSVPTSMITSTPVSSNLAPSRINILNSTIITPPHVASSVPQRIILPNQVKSSPVKISPTKAAIKSTPIKPMPNKNNKSATTRKSWTQNGSGVEELNLDFDSPYSPGSSDYEDLFEPPAETTIKTITTKSTNKSNTKSPQKHQSVFDALFGSPSYNKSKSKTKFGKKSITPTKTKTVGVKLDEDNLKILDELPNSAVEMQVKDKFLKKLNRQERVVEEVKLVLKPHYNKKRINKEEYKDILRRSVPKICHNKSGEINPTKIKNLIEAYVKKIRHSKKVTSSSSSVNPQKV